MKKWFPEMYDRPENGLVAVSVIYWGICYFMIPFVTLFLSWVFSTDLSVVIGVDLITYVVNFLCIFCLFRSYLADSWWNVDTNVGGFIRTVLISTGLILAVELMLLRVGMRWDWTYVFSAYPISETSVVADTCSVILAHPLWGILCMTLLTPITVSCMFYATVFAPVSVKRPMLAYAVTAALMILPRLLSIFWRANGFYDCVVYLLQLPVHMIACWSYQKTNAIWAPIISLAVSNLITSLFVWFLGFIGYIYIV